MASSPSCSVASFLYLEDQCHDTVHCRKAEIIYLKDLPATALQLLQHRTGIEFLTENDTICLHHQKHYLDRFEKLQTFCCDPWNRHAKHATKSLRAMSKETAVKLSSKAGKKFVQGMKLCPRCSVSAQDIEEGEESENEEGGSNEWECLETSEKSMEAVSKGLSAIGCSPIKMAKMNQDQKKAYTRKKFKMASSKLQSTMAAAIGEAGTSLDSETAVEKSKCAKCHDFDTLIADLKVKCSLSTKQEKIQIMTLAPKTWTVTETAETFGTTRYMAHKAMKLRQSDGVLAKPNAKLGRAMPESVKQAVLQFFNDDEVSRLCPGAKDFVSVKGVHHQKRLLLSNLKELYENFKERTGNRIGFSTFCEL